MLITRGVLDYLAKRHCADLQRIIERMAEARMAIELRLLVRQLQQLLVKSIVGSPPILARRATFKLRLAPCRWEIEV